MEETSEYELEKFPIWHSIEILIDPANPHDFIMKGFAGYKLAIFMGYLFIIFPLIALIYIILKW